MCPGINDGDILFDTLRGLEQFFPGVRSAALVPLGLTDHRKGLFQFQKVKTPNLLEDEIFIFQQVQNFYV